MATATALLQSLGLSAVCWDPSSLSWRGGRRRIRRRAIDGGRWRRDCEPEPPSPRPFSSSLRCQCQGVVMLETDPRQDSGCRKSTIGSGKGSFSSANGRRSVILTAMVPLILPLHQITEVVDSSQVSVIQGGVRNVLSKTKAAGILRMAFHDAGTFDINENSGGMNGSIIYELDRSENAGLGAHTIGSKGFGDPNVFDNAYYKILLEKPWTSSAGMSSMIGLPSDRALVEDDECLRWIKIYAGDQVIFFYDFRNAYIKLVDSGALWKGA
ncbi:hypothetical protein COCNU_03G016890 [Cocos nucifera]|uniref:Plant heme peroxidase family profile domain-containing protein n=1 Tax=Cocos nucifera TaxID=13894 RepID=A0A8K0I5B3_COCNU|nr:hypothetical protein COCNU_03G016890 [Cocos nucifera]